MATLTPEQVTQIPPAGRALFRIWQELPTTVLSEGELDLLILRITNHHEHDGAYASALRSSLTLAEAVTVRRGEGGELSYERAPEFPIHEPNGPGSDSFNRQLAEQAEAQHRQLDATAAAAYESSPQRIQRREVIALIDERIGELRRAVDVNRLRERLGK